MCYRQSWRWSRHYRKREDAENLQCHLQQGQQQRADCWQERRRSGKDGPSITAPCPELAANQPGGEGKSQMQGQIFSKQLQEMQLWQAQGAQLAPRRVALSVLPSQCPGSTLTHGDGDNQHQLTPASGCLSARAIGTHCRIKGNIWIFWCASDLF